MDLEKNKTTIDLSNAKSYVVICEDGENFHIGLHGDRIDLINVISNALLKDRDLRDLIKDAIEALEEFGSYKPTPPEEVN